MFDELEPYLAEFLPEERVGILMEILESTHNHLGVVCEDRINFFIEDTVDLDPDQKADELDAIVDELLDATLTPLGIKLDDDQYHSGFQYTASKILQALFLVNDFEDPDLILGGLNTDGDNRDVLAEIAYLVTGHPRDQFLIIIESVERNIIDTIVTIIDDKVNELHAKEQGLINTIWQRYREKKASVEDSLIDGYVAQGGSIGLSLTNLSKILVGQILERPEKYWAPEFVNMTLISSVPDTSVIQGALRVAEIYVDGYDALERVTSAIKTIYASWRK